MDLSSYLRMDPNILLGIVNEKLRLECDSVEEFALVFGIDQHSLSERLATVGYHYDPLHNQFVAV